MNQPAPINYFTAFAGAEAVRILRNDPTRLRDASDRFALHLIGRGFPYNTARRYASDVLRFYGCRRPVGRPPNTPDVTPD